MAALVPNRETTGNPCPLLVKMLIGHTSMATPRFLTCETERRQGIEDRNGASCNGDSRFVRFSVSGFGVWDNVAARQLLARRRSGYRNVHASFNAGLARLPLPIHCASSIKSGWLSRLKPELPTVPSCSGA